jgi:hypothetical protein
VLYHDINVCIFTFTDVAGMCMNIYNGKGGVFWNCFGKAEAFHSPGIIKNMNEPSWYYSYSPSSPYSDCGVLTELNGSSFCDVHDLGVIGSFPDWVTLTRSTPEGTCPNGSFVNFCSG